MNNINPPVAQHRETEKQTAKKSKNKKQITGSAEAEQSNALETKQLSINGATGVDYVNTASNGLHADFMNQLHIREHSEDVLDQNAHHKSNGVMSTAENGTSSMPNGVYIPISPVPATDGKSCNDCVLSVTAQSKKCRNKGKHKNKGDTNCQNDALNVINAAMQAMESETAAPTTAQANGFNHLSNKEPAQSHRLTMNCNLFESPVSCEASSQATNGEELSCNGSVGETLPTAEINDGSTSSLPNVGAICTPGTQATIYETSASSSKTYDNLQVDGCSTKTISNSTTKTVTHVLFEATSLQTAEQCVAENDKDGIGLSTPVPSPTSATPTPSLDLSNVHIEYKEYESELQMHDIMRLIQAELSEPYSIYTYRYFIYNWPKLCFLAAHGREYVGAIVCKLDMHMNVKRGYIAMLAVRKEYRKLKIGTTLVQKAIEAMLADNADEVVLETEMRNVPALRLYENLGFVRDKRLFRYYLNGVDALRLKLWFR